MAQLLSVGFGCAVGAVVRYALNTWLDGVCIDAVAIMVINLAGCLLMGVCTGLIVSWRPSECLAKMMTTGFCGGLTTFSTFSGDAVRLLRQDPGVALAIIAGSMIGGVVCYLVGRRLVRRRPAAR